MIRGRKPAPRSRKRVQGKITAAEDEAARSGDLPAAPEIPPPPPELGGPKNERARETWKVTAERLWRMGRLPSVSELALLRYCLDAQSFLRNEAKVLSHGDVIPTKNRTLQLSPFLVARNAAADRMARFESEFGLTPSSTMRVGPVLPPQPAGSPSKKATHGDANPAAKWFGR